MIFETLFSEGLPADVLIQPGSTAGSGTGARTLGSAKTFHGRIEQKRRLVMDSSGQNVTSNAAIYVPPYSTDGAAASFSLLDKVTLPAGFVPQSPRVLAIHRHEGDFGVVFAYTLFV